MNKYYYNKQWVSVMPINKHQPVTSDKLALQLLNQELSLVAAYKPANYIVEAAPKINVRKLEQGAVQKSR